MCGIVGVVDLKGRRLRTDRLKPMVDAIAHRGPDDAGYLLWQSGRQHPRGGSFGQAFTEGQFAATSPLLPLIDSPSGRQCLADETWDVFLGHRRLSVIDLSARGHQPLSDRTQTLWLTYNGEIYNFRELRRELEKAGYRFQSHTDSEVVLYAYQEWGEECVHRFNGMFAFAIWDARRRHLFLARDRYGIKPLYFLNVDGCFVFASEIKAIREWLGKSTGVDLLALNEYFSFQNVFSDRTLFRGVTMLPAAHTLSVDLASGALESHSYWDFDFDNESSDSPKQIEEQLTDLLDRAVRRQCVSDVPIGSYLSGGMDSGTVAAIASRALGRIFTFTMGFDLSDAATHELKFDERKLAEQLSNVLQTEHYECVLHSGDMEASLTDVVWALEDLRTGQSYPNFYVAKLASKFVKVVLSGVGGDELFGGYPWRYANALAGPGEDYVQNYYGYWQRLVSNRDKPKLFSRDAAASLRELDDEGARPFVDHTLSVFRRRLTANGKRHVDATSPEAQIRNSLYFECKTFLHGLLVVEDKLAMAHSLESRVPFLDNDLVDFASRIPVHLKVPGCNSLRKMDENLIWRKKAYYRSGAGGKDILRRSMRRLLPDEYTEASKQGFSAPDESWFRGRSAEFVRARLYDSASPLYDYLDRDFVRAITEQHISGQQNKRLLIWSLLSFQKWLELFD